MPNRFPNPPDQFKKGKVQSEMSKEAGKLAGPMIKNNPVFMISQRLRRLREKGVFTPEEVEWFKGRFSDPSISAVHMMIKLELAYKEGELTEKEYLIFAEKLHKVRHGEKIEIDMKRMNVYLPLTQQERDEFMDILRGKDQRANDRNEGNG